MTNGDWPVADPIFTGSLIDDILKDVEEQGPRPKAFDTLFRYSDSGSCSRKLALQLAGIPPSNPPDEAGYWVMHLGQLVHERAQEAICRKFPGARVEVVSQLEECSASGSADGVFDDISAVVEWEGGRVLYELKSMGGFAYAKAIGVDKRKYAQVAPEGPRITAKIQGAVNAYAHDCDTLVVANLALEGISKQLAARAGISERRRCLAEWHYPREVWEPWARQEIARLRAIQGLWDEGVIADRYVVGDDGRQQLLDPSSSRQDWHCAYCAQLENCVRLGPGEIKVPDA